MTAITYTAPTNIGASLPLEDTPTLSAYVTAGGAQVITATQLVDGYCYNGAAGGAQTLTLPSAILVADVLIGRGITPTLGMSLQPVIIDDTDAGANALTVTAGANFTVVGGPAGIVDNQTAIVYCFFTDVTDGAETMTAIVVKDT